MILIKYKQQRYNPNKQLDLTKIKNKLNNIIQKDLNKKDYNNIKELVEEKQNNIIDIKNNDKIKKILPPSENKKKKYKK